MAVQAQKLTSVGPAIAGPEIKSAPAELQLHRGQHPGGEARYGIQAGQNRGTVWFSEMQMRKGPGLSLGC